MQKVKEKSENENVDERREREEEEKKRKLVQEINDTAISLYGQLSNHIRENLKLPTTIASGTISLNK